MEFLDNKNREEILSSQQEIQNVSGENISRNLAFLAHSINKTKKQTAQYNQMYSAVFSCYIDILYYI